MPDPTQAKPYEMLDKDGNPIPFDNIKPTDYTTTNLSDTNLLPGQRNLDNYTRAVLDAQFQRSQDPSQEESFLKSSLNAGNVFGDRVGGEASKMGLSSLGDALQRKYSKDYGDKISALGRSFDFAAPTRQAQRLADTIHNMSTDQQLKNRNYQEQVAYYNRVQDIKRQYELARQAAQSSFFSSVLGFLGTAGGIAVGAMTGGAGAVGLGAAIGAQAGSNIGAAAGS